MQISIQNLIQKFFLPFVLISIVSVNLSNAASESSGDSGISQISSSYPTEVIEAGRAKFISDCGFCHGRDAAGGAGGVDLVRSELVEQDNEGDLISEVVRNGRADTPMPAFGSLTNAELNSIVAFIYNQKLISESVDGGRRSVLPADLETGNAVLGQRYFQNNCSRCHSATGDLAGIASRLEGLPLLQRMLNPNSGRARLRPSAVVTQADGAIISGTLAYRDEFTIALTDASGRYFSWLTKNVTYTVDDKLEAHVEQLALYSDEDMHNVLAFLQTLR